MNENDSKSLDILGLKPVADSINTVTKASVEGASAFLSRICLPAAVEFGLLLRDKISNWRINNTICMTQKAEEKFGKFAVEGAHAHPRLAANIIDKSSWSQDNHVQDMWAGLLASSCTKDAKDESNIIFINILSQITSLQTTILNYGCEKAEKTVTEAGWIAAEPLIVELEELTIISGSSDFHRLDRELDHLRSLQLIGGGFDPNSTQADITPTALALQMFVRCQGFIGSPIEYFDLEKKEPNNS